MTTATPTTYRVLGHELIPVPGQEGHAWDNDPCADRLIRVSLNELSWPVGNPAKWYVAMELVTPSAQTPGRWHFEGPFCGSPEAAVREFESSWDAHLSADRRRAGAP